MSPALFNDPISDGTQATLDRIWAGFGERVRDMRQARHWSTRRLATEAKVSRSVIYLVERGEPTSVETCARVSSALGMRLEVELVDPRKERQNRTTRAEDPVHAAMGELEARHLRSLGFQVGIDEPFQHFQFAGRGDVVAWSLESRALLHIENKTRFPNVGEAAGAWNAKRAYLPTSLADRLGIGRWRSVSHVMVALWSAEVLRAVRSMPGTFRSLCPDPDDAFTDWSSGAPPATGSSTTLVLFDPLASDDRPRSIDLTTALLPETRSRVKGYADAARRLGRLAAR